jgi:hypothetical protein
MLVPEPFLAEGSNQYVQIFTKAEVSRGQLATDCYRDVGLPAEIVPLSQPHNAIVGSTFVARCRPRNALQRQVAVPRRRDLVYAWEFGQ